MASIAFHEVDNENINTACAAYQFVGRLRPRQIGFICGDGRTFFGKQLADRRPHKIASLGDEGIPVGKPLHIDMIAKLPRLQPHQ
jgi:hypothetical protein